MAHVGLALQVEVAEMLPAFCHGALLFPKTGAHPPMCSSTQLTSVSTSVSMTVAVCGPRELVSS